MLFQEQSKTRKLTNFDHSNLVKRNNVSENLQSLLSQNSKNGFPKRIEQNPT